MMNLTIDNGNTVYYFRSSHEIQSIRVDSGDEFVSYQANAGKSLIRSGPTATTVCSIAPDMFVVNEFASIELGAPVAEELTPISNLHQVNERPLRVRRAASELARALTAKTCDVAQASAAKLAKLWQKTKKTGKRQLEKRKARKSTSTVSERSSWNRNYYRAREIS